MPTKGRPLKINKKLIEMIATALSNGLSRETSARYAHITYQTFITWYKRGRAEKDRIDNGEPEPSTGHAKQEKIYLIFLDQVELAETDAIVGWQDTINRAAKNDPTWAHKMLGLRDPRSYRTVEVNATLDLSKATDEQLQRIANGESPIDVMANSGASNPGTATPPKPE